MTEKLANALRTWSQALFLHIRVLAKWFAAAVSVGLISGFAGSLFHMAVEYVTELRGAWPWLLYCLPLAGLLIVAVYKLDRTEGQGTNDVFDAIRQNKRLSPLLFPSIFCGTVLTHLCGGSAGREGAALQMGGVVGCQAGRVLRFQGTDLHAAIMTGMAAFFSALFGTPLSAAAFAIAAINVGAVYQSALLPCLTASLIAYGVTRLLGLEPTHFAVQVPPVDAWLVLKTAVLAALCAAVSMLFCTVIHGTEHLLKRRIPNPWVRVFAGGCAIIVLTLLCGTTDYNGAGMDVIAAAVEQGQAHPAAFLLKLVFTAVTLGAGFKGGEVVPSFFVGAAFGCTAGPLLGIPAGFAAAVGLVSVFCGAANAPIVSIFLAAELFGWNGMGCYALACAVSFSLSGRGGLYSSQGILRSNLDGRRILPREAAAAAPKEEAAVIEEA